MGSITDSKAAQKFKRDPRLGGWVGLTIFSVVCLVAIMVSTTATKGADEKWVISVSSISLAFALLASLAYFFLRDKFVDEMAEGIVAVLLLAIWVGGLPVIMNPSRDLAVSVSADTGKNFVSDANLYFFSWAAFICIVYICGSYMRKKLPDVETTLSSITPKLAKWYMLVAISVVVLASAAEFHRSQDCRVNDTAQCQRNKYAISLGCIGTVIGIVAGCLASTGNMNIYLESGLAVMLLGLYTAGIALITFDQGSGTTIGNLYFSTWGGWVVTILLAVECYHGVRAEREQGSSINTAMEGPSIAVTNAKQEQDIVVEDLPEDPETQKD